MKEWKLKKVIQILTACLAMIVVLNVSGISMKTMHFKSKNTMFSFDFRCPYVET